jgi:hypothetical protein
VLLDEDQDPFRLIGFLDGWFAAMGRRGGEKSCALWRESGVAAREAAALDAGRIINWQSGNA